MTDMTSRQALAQAASPSQSKGQGIWLQIKAMLDFASYKPEAVANIVISELTGKDGRYYVIKNPATRTYYRLGERDYFLWQRMDGTQSVKDLVVAYYMEYGAFAFAQVAGLVKGLKGAQFLVDQPANVYSFVQDQLERRTLDHRLQRVGNAFIETQIAINGLDGLLDKVYRYGGWIFFTTAAMLISVALIVIGIVAFLVLFTSGRYALVLPNSSLSLTIITILVTNFVTITLHELGHALAVKHFQREVRRGGFMLYYGMPAFFIDTTDIWLAPKRARLTVTWAGPHISFLTGAVATIPLLLFPEFALNPFLFSFAAFNFFGAFLNLNPLLELDGYYLLMDWLEIPQLRKKSLTYLRTELVSKLRESKVGGLRTITFSQTEKVFVVYGLLTAVYTVIALYLAVDFYQSRAVSYVQALWLRASDAARIALIIIGVVLCLGAALLVFRLIRLTFRRFVTWAEQRGLLDKPWYIAVAVWSIVVLSIIPESFGYMTFIWAYAGLVAMLIAAYFAWRNATVFAGGRLAPVFHWLALAALLLAIVQGTGILSLTDGNLLDALEILPAVAFLIAGGLLVTGHWSRTQTQPIRASILFAALGIGGLLGWLAYTREASDLSTVGIFSAYVLTFVLCLPTLWFRRHTMFAPAWLTFCLALLGFAVIDLFRFATPLPFFLLTAATILHYQAVLRLRFPLEQVATLPGASDRARLQFGFVWIVESVTTSLRQVVGQHDTVVVAEQFNALAQAANWPVEMNGTDISDKPEVYLDLFEQGNMYASMLSLLLDLDADTVGDRIIGRMFQSAYDRLPWQVREIAALHLFPDVKRAASADKQFQTDSRENHALLRRMPLFATMSDQELDLLATQLQSEHFRPNQIVMRQGDTGNHFYIIKHGHVEVEQRNDDGVIEIVDQLNRGDYLGELALLHDAPRNATCRATVPTELLSLSRANFERLVKERFALYEKLDETVTRTALLRRIPLFAEMDTQQLQLIVSQLRQESYASGDYFIHQGTIGDAFYIIESGQVVVTVNQNGQEVVVDKHGPGAYVGEIALLLDTPRTASVSAVKPTQTLTLYKHDFNRLVTNHLYVSRGLEMVMSRRMIQIRRTLPALSSAQ